MFTVSSKSPVHAETQEPKTTFKQRLSQRFYGAKKDFGSPWLVILNVFLIFAFSQFVAIFAIGLGLNLIRPNQSSANILDQSAAAQFIYVLLAESLAVLIVFWIIKRRGLRPAAIGWGRKPRLSDLTKGLLGFLAFFFILVVATAVLTTLFPELKSNQTQDVGFNSLNSGLDWALAFVALILIPPLGEETLVRGYLYSGLRARWRFVPAMVVTSLLFGLAHLQSGTNGSLIWGAALDTFILSLVLVYLREVTGALYAGILIHSLNNLLAFLSHFHALIF